MARTIIIATDGSPRAQVAQDAASSLLDLTACDVIVTTVVPETDPTLVTGAGFAGPVISQEDYAADRQGIEARAHQVLDEAADRLRARGAAVRTEVTWGDPGPAIIALADGVDAAVIVVGTRGAGGLARAVMGSVADHVVRRAGCPVLVVGPVAEATPSGHVVVGVDDSDQAPVVLAAARTWFTESLLSIVTVRDEVEELIPFEGSQPDHSLVPASERRDRAATEEARAHQLVSELVAAAGLPSSAVGPVLVGDAGPALIDAAVSSDARALVVGTRGRGGLRRALLGSVADRVIRGAPCPVLVVPPPRD